MPSTWTCKQAIAAIRSLDFTGWQGVPADCTPAALAAAFPREREDNGSTQLGSSGRRVEVARLRRPGGEPLEVSIDRGAVVRIDLEYPQLAGGLDAHVKALGPPAARRTYHWDVIEIVDGELLWPARGLAIYVGLEPTDVKRIGLFAATDLATYERDLRPDLQSHELPTPER